MVIKADGDDRVETERAWMIEEFRLARQRREATRASHALLPPEQPGSATGDPPALLADVVVITR